MFINKYDFHPKFVLLGQRGMTDKISHDALQGDGALIFMIISSAHHSSQGYNRYAHYFGVFSVDLVY